MPIRKIKKKGLGESKSRIPSHKTIYGQVEYKSKLEADAAEILASNGIEFIYEGATFNVMPSFISTDDCYAQLRKKTKTGTSAKFDKQPAKVEAITYTPDFIHINADKTGWVIETKGVPNESFPLRFKLFKKFLHENGYNLTLFIPRNKEQIYKCVEIIKQNQNKTK